MKCRISALAIALAAAQVIFTSRADDAPKKDAPAGTADDAGQVRGEEITDAQRAAVDKGLEWLAQRQKPDGKDVPVPGYSNHAGVTALVGLAFLRAGNLPSRGKYSKELQYCLEFVLRSVQESGLIASDASQAPMYGHAFATLFLAEVYAKTQDKAVKEKLEKAVGLIEKVQSKEGGWRYQPAPYDADLSVTACQIVALGGARNAGIKVEKDVMDKAVKYVRRCQNQDGGFSYMANQGGGMGGSGFPRSAGGVCALYSAGVAEDHNLEKALRYVQQFAPGTKRHLNEGHFYYGYYYGTQAMCLAGKEYRATFYPAIRQDIIARQQGDHWVGDFSDDYATAMALIILQMPSQIPQPATRATEAK